ncbi:hypothetical protein KC19_8G087500 [Ceratodon purpureus]|uniref:Uncharacterized protein n=1 Tax=Ceratodon purpureus TaxID=3225 RepID=A0A8T0GWL0_CERPU|nr:hypothetical protein KC19_8G087500 [Ceratodon purpureus]
MTYLRPFSFAYFQALALICLYVAKPHGLPTALSNIGHDILTLHWVWREEYYDDSFWEEPP